MMHHRGMAGVGRAPEASELSELLLALPAKQAKQASALVAAAERQGKTVGALVRQVVADYLRTVATAGFVGQEAGRPTAPRATPDERF